MIQVFINATSITSLFLCFKITVLQNLRIVYHSILFLRPQIYKPKKKHIIDVRQSQSSVVTTDKFKVNWWAVNRLETYPAF